MTNKMCSDGYEWCHGGSLPDCSGDHSSIGYQTATLGQGAPCRLGDEDEPMMIGTGVRFNTVDGDPAPSIIVHVQGGPEGLDVQVDLRIKEAYEFSRLLDAALVDATTVTLGLLPDTLAADWFGGVQR